MSVDLCPSIFSLPHTATPSNSRPTATLAEQLETEQLISKLLALTAPPSFDSTSSNEPNPTATTLRRQDHNVFLASTLFKSPAEYVALDASRPWLLFWTAHSLDLLGIALDQNTKNRYVALHNGEQRVRQLLTAARFHDSLRHLPS